MDNLGEIGRLIIRLVGDADMYIGALNDADRETKTFVEDATGKFRDLSGKFVSAQAVIQNNINQSILKLQNFGKALQTVGGHLDKLGNKMVSFGRTLSIGVTTPLIASGVLAVKTFADYERSLNNMIGLANVNAQGIEEFNQAIREMAPAVGKGPKELADALFFIAGAGFKGQSAINILEASAKAASAGLGETKVVADAVTSAVNAYGESNLSAARATDILTAAVREGKAEADTLAPVLGVLLPTSSAMGISFEQVAGILAVMSRTGLNASEAATSLQAVMATLLKPSKEAAETLAEAGLSMKQLREVARGPDGLIDVMRILERTFDDNDEALSTVIPNVRAFRGFMNVLAQDASIVDKIMTGVADSVGAADNAFDAGADTVNRKWNQAMADLQIAMLDLGNALVPWVDTLTSSLKTLTDWFTKLDASGKSWVVTLGLIAAATGPVLIVLGSLVGVLASVVTAIGTLLATEAGLLALTTTLSALATAWIALLPVMIGGVIYGLYRVNPVTWKYNEALEAMGETAKKTAAALTNDLAAAMKEVGESTTQSGKFLGFIDIREDLKGKLKSTQDLIAATKADLSKLENQNPISRQLDAMAIGMTKQDIADLEARAKMFEGQLVSVNDQIKIMRDETEAAAKAGAEMEIPTIKLRPEAIAEFQKSLEQQLRHLEIEMTGKQLGLSDELIGRQQAAADLVAELAAEGKSLNDQERERTREINKQLNALERQRKTQEDAKKLMEDQAKQAAKILEEAQTPIEELRNKILEIGKLGIAGALTPEEAMKAQDRLVQEFAKAKGSIDATGGEAVSFGSQEAEFNRKERIDASTEKGVWELVRNADNQLRTEEQILEELKKKPQPVPLVAIPGG